MLRPPVFFSQNDGSQDNTITKTGYTSLEDLTAQENRPVDIETGLSYRKLAQTGDPTLENTV